jgi:hypothetical protein
MGWTSFLETRVHVIGDVLRVAPNSREQPRLDRVHPVEAKEVQPWSAPSAEPGSPGHLGTTAGSSPRRRPRNHAPPGCAGSCPDRRRIPRASDQLHPFSGAMLDHFTHDQRVLRDLFRTRDQDHPEPHVERSPHLVVGDASAPLDLREYRVGLPRVLADDGGPALRQRAGPRLRDEECGSEMTASLRRSAR